MTDVKDIAKLTDSLSDTEKNKLIRLIQQNFQNTISWKERHEILNEYRVIDGKKWFKLLVAQNNETNEKFLRAYRLGQSLSIKTKAEFTKFLTHLKTGAINLDWYDAGDAELFQSLDDYIAKNKDQNDKIDTLRSNMAELKERLINMDISQFEEALKEFKRIYTGKHDESDIQEFLKNNAWILGDEYVYQQPVFFSQFPMWQDKLDFFIKRYDGYYDIIEIKKGNAKLFLGLDERTTINSPTRKSPMSGELKDAISQIINYLEEANTYRHAIHDINSSINIHKPRGFVIIGKSNPKYDKAIITLNDYLNDIRILTYDDLYAKANSFIVRIKKGH